MSVETCLKLKTRTLKAEATTFGSGFGADIVLTCSVHEFRVLSLATLSCCPKSNFAKNDVATKQMTTRLTFIEAPHKVPLKLAGVRCYLNANEMKNG